MKLKYSGKLSVDTKLLSYYEVEEGEDLGYCFLAADVCALLGINPKSASGMFPRLVPESKIFIVPAVLESGGTRTARFITLSGLISAILNTDNDIKKSLVALITSDKALMLNVVPQYIKGVTNE